jgi:hypothetical protein
MGEVKPRPQYQFSYFDNRPSELYVGVGCWAESEVEVFYGMASIDSFPSS